MSEPNTEVLTADVSTDGTIVVVGDIDMAGGPVLETAILSREAAIAANEGDKRDVTIDLELVSFIDSSGLRSLLGAMRRATERDGRVVLRSVGPEVARLLEITGTVDHFTIESRRG